MVAKLEDPALLRRYAHDGDAEAFGELVRRYLGFVYHTALRQLDEEAHLAGDVGQKVFVLLARKATGLSRHPALAGWLHTTTRNVARETLRGERRRRAREQEAFMRQTATDDRSERDLEWKQLRPVIDEALEQLDAGDREVVLLRYFADQPHAQIGARLAISENAARMRVDRALDRLRAVLSRRGITSTSAALGVVLANHVGASAPALPAGLAASVTGAALAQAGASGWLALGLMSLSRNAMMVGGVCVLGALFVPAWWEMRQATAAGERAESTRRETAALVAQRQEVARQTQAADREATAAKKKLADAEAAQTRMPEAPRSTVGPAPTGRDPNWDPVAAGRALMERYPELKRAVVARADATTNFTYGPMFRELGFTPAQEQAFRELMRESGGISAPFGPRGETYSFRAGTDLSMETFDTRLRDLLGDANYAQLGEFLRLKEARSAAAQVAAVLAFSDTPVFGGQAQRLVDLMMDTARTPRCGSSPPNGRRRADSTLRSFAD